MSIFIYNDIHDISAATRKKQTRKSEDIITASWLSFEASVMTASRVFMWEKYGPTHPGLEDPLYAEVEYTLDDKHIIRETIIAGGSSVSEVMLDRLSTGMKLLHDKEKLVHICGEYSYIRNIGDDTLLAHMPAVEGFPDSDYALTRIQFKKYINVLPLLGINKIKDIQRYNRGSHKIHGVLVPTGKFLPVVKDLDEGNIRSIGMALFSLSSNVWGIGHPIQLGRAIEYLYCILNNKPFDGYIPMGKFTRFSITKDKSKSEIYQMRRDHAIITKVNTIDLFEYLVYFYYAAYYPFQLYEDPREKGLLSRIFGVKPRNTK